MLVTDRADFSPFVSLRSFKQGESLSLKKGVIISSKLATTSPGYSWGTTDPRWSLLRWQESLKIMLAILSIWIRRVTKKSMESGLQKISYLVQLRNSSTRQVQAVSRDMMALAAVKAVSQNASMISLFNSVAKSLDTTMMILVVVSVLLAIVILYKFNQYQCGRTDT